MIHRLEFSQDVAAAPEVCWAFFSNPANLGKITPPELGFAVVSRLPELVYEGLIVAYRVHPFFEIPMNWVTEISHVQPPFYFCDDQRIGPYRLWHHEHFFEPATEGGTRVRDVIHYAVRGGPLGELLRPYLVAPRLAAIFDYRRRKIAELLR